LLSTGLKIDSFKEYPFVPHNLFEDAIEQENGRFYSKFKEKDKPLLFSITAQKEISWNKAS
jgi:hypothetical protein